MQKALFLDRDGVINIDNGYVYKQEDFIFNEGIFALLKIFIEQKYIIFIVTNQSGIARGYYSLKDFQKLSQWMLEIFATNNISIQSIEHCPHLPTEYCPCRKPRTGMIDKILREYSIDLNNSWLIGDKQSDIDLAHNAKIKYSIAIGENTIKNTSYCFSSIALALKYFQKEHKAFSLNPVYVDGQ
ncbi:D-glycero-D-manno-heptose 1,7-bisphosphate phosphatase [hydrothermal vent metagenome]|uniref:D,D-heptose 1,7-bisphosphate phosphatase n=1 Tax=hydrothermal vent metagenome TaxID=652676 RepID=A0A1W1C6E8_9ZZZZ